MKRYVVWVLLVGFSVLASLGVGRCHRPCSADWHCGGGQVCVALCPADCPPGEDCCAPGRCFEARCLQDNDCPPGSACQLAVGQPGFCEVTPCTSELGCAEGAYCAIQSIPGAPGSQSSGICLPEQCDFDADCPAETRCEGSSVCPPDVTCIWEGEPGVCVGTECREEEDCPLGTTCSDGFCAVLAP